MSVIPNKACFTTSHPQTARKIDCFCWSFYILCMNSHSYILNSYAFPHFFVQGDAAISYGTSPEWVEVDGMIVSRSGTTVHLTNALNSLHNSATSRSNAKTTNSHGYVSISLTIVTYCHVNVFFNFSCMFLYPNVFFQFEFLLF